MLEPSIDNMHDLSSGNTMYGFAGIGHSDEAIIEAVRHHYESDLDGYRLAAYEARWGWSPRFKWCSNHDTGWGCDEEGEWHRHFSTNYGDEPSTTVTVNYTYPMGDEPLAPVVVEWEHRMDPKPEGLHLDG